MRKIIVFLAALFMVCSDLQAAEKMDLKAIAKGEFAIETEVSKKVEYHRNHIELHEDLTARERDILGLLAKGYENQRI